ncbi:TonB-dependent receptor [Sulfuricella sp.]|uniref:TonB-dependent receptor n=1 Tax=Sulfuricella sp. TaxID=2099377 RepID=UPI002B8AC43A|nr:TonB-dependent receptor [Sulfuricella sp.]HUX64939.1 TonB-dependent receptor [Sulfuricella sp.]
MSFKHKTLAVGIALALVAPLSAQAADNAELAQIREQIRQMKESYEARIQSLEKRLQQAESTAGNALDKAGKAEEKAVQAAAAPAALPSASAGAFNPEVSLILSGTYANLSQDPANYRIGGFLPNGGEIGPGARGFNLGESELAIAANIDPYLRGQFTLAVTPENTVAVEEAFVQSLGLGNGLTVKGGRFLSGVGYLNEQHAHTWDFTDAPLAYQAFFGGQFKDEGVQLKWLAPTDTFVELGAEVGRGRNFPASDRAKNGFGSATLFAHLGGDVGASHSWRAGLSLLRTSPRDRAYRTTDNLDTAVDNSFSGVSRLEIADFVWKWAPDGNPVYTNFKLQGEYFRRREDGDLTYAVSTANNTDRYASSQSGWYLQGVYQFMPRWRVGLRRDQLDGGSVDYASNSAVLGQAAFNPSKNSLMFDYSPSEFSRFRLQFAQDKSRPEATDNQMFLQYQMSLGAHGAHKY